MKKVSLKALAFTGIFAMVSAFFPDTRVNEISAASDNTKLIALTFDDGPNTTTTNDVLDVLEL